MTLRVKYPTPAALEADYRDNLSKGRVFVAGLDGVVLMRAP